MKRLLSLLLVLVLVLGAVPMTALAANPFTDVPQNQWYYADIDSAYQNGLINGKTPTLYMPDDFLTYAEAVKLAAAMNQRYTTGSVTLQNGQPWYQTYVDYCKTKGIIYVDYAWNQNATRAGYMDIFANALPSSAMQEINNIPDGSIPDVPMSHPQADAIYKLYRVGILQGNDLQHNCNPGANIKRSEVAAILTRMMDSSKRIQFSMDADALRFTKNPAEVTVNPGETATLSVEVTGGKTPYQYQWSMSRDGAREQWYDVSGKTEATISVKTDASAAGATMAYRCKVTDAAGTTLYSDLGSITVGAKELKVTTQPADVEGESGQEVMLQVAVEGGKAPYTYTWKSGSTVINGRTGTRIRGGKDTVADGTSYTYSELYITLPNDAVIGSPIYCVVKDADGKEITSNSVTVTMKAKPLKIINQPESIYAQAGDRPEFFVEVEGGNAPYSFQWMSKNAYGSGSVEGVYGVQTYDDMYWSKMQVIVGNGSDWTTNEEFYCVITDAAGNKVTSDTFTITLKGPVTITTNAVTDVKANSTVELVAVAHGGNSGQYKFIWMGGNSHTTAVSGWNGVTITTTGNKSVMTIDTSVCKDTIFAVRVEDAKDSSNYAVKEWSYRFLYG